jgi:Spy/CpxP family protein refolding chaperone
MKRKIWSTAAVVVLAAATAISVMAQPPQGRGGRGFGPGGPGGPGFPILRELNLTDAQREQVRAIQKARAADRTQPGKLAQLERDLRLAVLADTPDAQKVEQLKTSIAAAATEQLAARVEIEMQIAQILTPEQRAQAREALAKAGTAQQSRRGRAGRQAGI